MNIRIRILALVSFAAFAFAGCSSYSEIARWDSNVPLNGYDAPLATFVTQNFSYQLFGCIPMWTGRPWTEGNDDIMDDYRIKFFADEATLDNNMVSLRHALDVVGSHNIIGLESSFDDSYFWSLFILNRHEVRTKCIILKPDAARQPSL